MLKDTSSPVITATIPVKDEDTSPPGSTNATASRPYASNQIRDLYAGLPDSLEICVDPCTGRGIYLKSDAKAVKAGSITILNRSRIVVQLLKTHLS
jgi:hypothetical protein